MLIIVITVEICTVFFGCLLLWKYWPPQNRLCPKGRSLQNISKKTTKIKHFVLKFPGLFCFEFFSWLLSESGTPKSTWPVQNSVKCCTRSELPVVYLISGTRSPGVANILRTCVQQMQCLEKMCITRTILRLPSWAFASHTYKELHAGPTDNSTSQSFLRHFCVWHDAALAMKGGWSCMQMNGRKLVLIKQLETGVGSELPLTSFSDTHPGLAAVKITMFWQLTFHPNIRETETEWETDCLNNQTFN